MAVALAFRGAALAFMAGSDEGLQSALFNISDPAFEASSAVLGAPIPGILPGRIEKARRSAEPTVQAQRRGPRSRRGLDPVCAAVSIAVHETSRFGQDSLRWLLPRYTPTHARVVILVSHRHEKAASCRYRAEAR